MCHPKEDPPFNGAEMKNSPEISGELEKGRRQSDAALTHAIKQGTGAGLRRITENAPERFPFQGVTGTSKASVRRSTCAVQLTASSSIQTVLSAPESHRIVRLQVLAAVSSFSGICFGSRAGSIPAEGSERKLDTAGGEFHPALKISDSNLRTRCACCQYQYINGIHQVH